MSVDNRFLPTSSPTFSEGIGWIYRFRKMNELYKKPNLSPNEGIFSDVETAFDFSLIEVKDEKVNARGLHKFLGNKREFATWIKDRLTDFDEGIDFDKIVKPHENNKKE